MSRPDPFFCDEIGTPIGTLLLVAGETGVCVLDFDGDAETVREALGRRFGEVELRRRRDPGGFSARVRDYFAGELRALDAIPADPGGTPFQAAVWRALRGIPAGRTASYAAIAQRIGRPSAVRAVGAANGRNPVALIIPCHRVIGADGSLTGYGGGIERKRWLLAHEGAATRSSRTLFDAAR
jgi:methylated-DNA-[protein]-cysteine S-methyltransferase